MSSLAENYRTVKARIEKALVASQSTESRASSVQLIAVSKTRPAEAIRELSTLGHRDFGENYLQESLEKKAQLTDLDLVWHFIGPIQGNKTRQIAENFDWVHTVDRAKIAQRLNDQRPAGFAPISVCIQVNLDDEPTKSGVSAEDLFDLAKTIAKLSQLRLRGLMFIPAPRPTPEAQLETCRKAKALFDQIQVHYPQIDCLSLGMSADLEAAVKSGSTMVRIGTDIFGARIKPES